MANATRRLKIQVSQGGRVVRSETFDELPILIGRSDECQLRFAELGFVSRLHAAITIDDEEIVVTDLNSKNGLKYRGAKAPVIRERGNIRFSIKELDFLLEVQGEGPFVDDELTAISVYRAPLGGEALGARGSLGGLELEDVPDHVRFSIAPIPRIEETPRENICVQGVITWDTDIYDVRNYLPGDALVIGPDPSEPIYLPLSKARLSAGVFQARGAELHLPSKATWKVFRRKVEIPRERLATERVVTRERDGTERFILGVDEVASLELGSGLALHLRYVAVPRLKIARTWIENREEYKKAIVTSALIHLFVTFAAVVITPPVDAPKIDHVPPRIAKLVVEPPSQILAAKPFVPPTPPPTPPPAVPTPPPPTPPPPAVVEKVVPPKREVKPPPQAVQKPKLAAKRPEAPLPRPNTASAPRQASAPAAPSAPQPSAEEQQLLSLLNTLPAPPSGATGSSQAPIKISKAQISEKGPKVGGVAAVAAAAGTSSKGDGPPETSFKVGGAGTSQGYSTKGQSGVAGKREVRGQVVGVPSLSPTIERVQGLSNEAVMAVVNKRLGDVQRCYERALFEDDKISGRVEYEWEIAPNGSVVSARVTRSEVARGDTLNNCVLALFRSLRFPTAQNGQSTVAKIGFPFGK